MNSNQYGSNQPVFQKLKSNIERLKVQRDQLNNDLAIDRNDLNNVEMGIAQLGREIDERMIIVRQKQRKLMQLQKAINDTEKSYEIIIETTRKLSNALQNQATHLRGLTRK